MQVYDLVGITEGHAATQRDLNRLEKQADSNLKQLNKGKCQDLHLSRNNPWHQCMLRADQLEISFADGGHQVEHEIATCRGPREGKWYPVLQYKEHCQQVKGGDPSPLLSTVEATAGMLGPVLGCTVQKAQGHTGKGPTKGQENEEGTHPFLKAEKAGIV